MSDEKFDQRYTLEERITARELIKLIRACSPKVAEHACDQLEAFIGDLLDELDGARCAASYAEDDLS